MIARTLTGTVQGVRARPWTFAGVTLGMLALHIAMPPLVLSLARKPLDYFAFNAWLPNLPSFLLAGEIPLGRKVEALWHFALFWFSSSSPYGIEWGFTVDVGDLVRFLLTSALIGVYFALWTYRRSRSIAPAWRARASTGGVVGGLVSVLGLSTGPCSVMGCGAPVIPVVGLALAGLSSTTLKLLHDVSTVAALLVLVMLAASVAYLGWLVGRPMTAEPLRT